MFCEMTDLEWLVFRLIHPTNLMASVLAFIRLAAIRL